MTPAPEEEEETAEDAATCIPKGSVEWDTDAFSGNAYQRLSAADKMDQLWSAITQYNTVICQQFDELENLFIQDPRQSFGNMQSDEMPGTRNKLVHQQGIVAKAEFVASDDSPYTGVFEGAEHVLIRMSETDLFVDGVTEAANPSIALKFLRDGIPSANQFGMVSFEGTNTWDFFGNSFMSHLPKHEGECGPKTIAKYHTQASRFVYQTGSLGLAEAGQDGTEVENPDFPYFLLFEPRNTLPTTDGNSRFFEQLNGNAIPAGSVLFDVLAVDENDNRRPEMSQNLTKIGEIRTTTNFRQSLWGDEKLFFNHGNLSNDIAARSEFSESPVLQFDEATWGVWPSNANVEDVDRSEVVAGMRGGCPFQWVIDQFDF